jgi:hypothetical protein
VSLARDGGKIWAIAEMHEKEKRIDDSIILRRVRVMTTESGYGALLIDPGSSLVLKTRAVFILVVFFREI